MELFAFATNRVHGLGMTVARFWGATWLELSAHRRVLDNSLDFHRIQHADVMAALYNGPLVRTDKQPWTSQMFLPGYARAKSQPDSSGAPSWKRERDAMMANITKAKQPDPVNTEEGRANVVMIDHRMRRAKEAREQGQSREVIEGILTGRG